MGVVTISASGPAEGRPLSRRLLSGRTAGSVLLASALALALVSVGGQHEPWFDEAQAWLIARDSTLRELFVERLRYEGSPGLWHLVLWALQRLGLSYGQLALVPTAFAVTGAWLVLQQAPFPLAMRIGIVLSYWFGYQYAIAARSYALDALLIPLLAIGFASRLDRPLRYGLLVGLLANANAHGFMMAASLGAEWSWACWRSGRLALPVLRAGLAIAVVLGLLAVAQTWPTPPDATFAAAHPTGLRFDRVPLLIGSAFVEGVGLFEAMLPDNVTIALGAMVSLICILPSIRLFRTAGPDNLVLFLAMVGALLSFSVVTHASPWHAGFLFLAWLFCLWISWPSVGRLPERDRTLLVLGVGAILTWSAADTLAAWRRDLADGYSAGAAAAKWIATVRPSSLAGMGFKTLAVQPYFPANVFANQAGGAPSPAFYEWDRRGTFPADASLDLLSGLARQGHDALLISSFGMDEADQGRLDAEARARGYCLAARFSGGMIWKRAVLERDDLVAFMRCAGAAG